MDNQIILEDENIRLIGVDTQLEVGDLTTWEISTSATMRSYKRIADPCSVAGSMERLTDADDPKVDRPSSYHFTALDTESGILVGKVHIGQLISSLPAAWLSVEMTDATVTKEEASMVMGLALRFAFIDLALHRVCVHIPSYKETEIDMYEEAGFLRESQRRQAVCHDDRLYDDLLYGMLRSEWLKMQQEVET